MPDRIKPTPHVQQTHQKTIMAPSMSVITALAMIAEVVCLQKGTTMRTQPRTVVRGDAYGASGARPRRIDRLDARPPPRILSKDALHGRSRARVAATPRPRREGRGDAETKDASR